MPLVLIGDKGGDPPEIETGSQIATPFLQLIESKTPSAIRFEDVFDRLHSGTAVSGTLLPGRTDESEEIQACLRWSEGCKMKKKEKRTRNHG